MYQKAEVFVAGELLQNNVEIEGLIFLIIHLYTQLIQMISPQQKMIF